MLATIYTMFVNEKVIGIYSFCPFSPWNTRQMHFKRSIVTKHSSPHDPPKIPHRGMGWDAVASWGEANGVQPPPGSVSSMVSIWGGGSFEGLKKTTQESWYRELVELQK